MSYKETSGEKSKLKIKTYFIFSVLILGFVGIISRVIYLQFIIRDELIAYSNDQFIRTAKIYPNRGQIYDRNGNPLAINVQRYDLFTMPKELSESKKELIKLSRLIPELKVTKVLSMVRKRNKFTWIKRNVELSKGQLSQIKELSGVYAEPVTRRFYPNNELLSQTLGFLGVDNKGLAGIEYLFNEKLKGKEKTISYVRDAKGRSVKFENLTDNNTSEDLYLSVDKEIQAVLERYLKEGVDYHKADGGGAGVIDARTGEILALANYPTFDANKKRKGSGKSRKLSFVSDPFEPGSVLKTISVASAIENETVNPTTIFYCEDGRYKVNDHYIKESANHQYKWLSVSDILKLSSNIGTTKIAFELGYKNLYKTFYDFRLTRETGVELPSESRGIFSDKEKVSQLRLSNLSFGQGIAVTGMQLLASYTPFANDGFLVRPTIFKRHTSPEKIQVISKSTVDKVVPMLEKVVSEGTGARAQISNYQIAGKTGTAQKPSASGGYEGYISSFIGFPLNIKKPFIVLVYIDNPRVNGYYGNEVAAPIFKEITEAILIKNNEFNTLADSSKKSLEKEDKKDEIKVSQAAIQRVVDGKTPDFVGLDKKTVLKVAEKLKIKIKINGYGIVKKQKPNAFSELPRNKTVKIYLEAPVYE